jgi:hypothetical protein
LTAIARNSRRKEENGVDKRKLDFAAMAHVTPDDMKAAHARRNGALGISVVNTERNGKRVKLTQALLEGLGSPKELQFVPDGEYLIIGPKIPYSTEAVYFSSGKGSNIIYDAGFVQYLTKRFKLDFSERTSFAFKDVELETQDFEDEQITFARICMSA